MLLVNELPKEEQEKYWADLAVYGKAYIKQESDGSIRYVSIQEIRKQQDSK